MQELIAAAFQLPTAVFSVLLLLAAAYWLLVLVGGLGAPPKEGMLGVGAPTPPDGPNE